MTNDIEALKARLRERAAAREFGADPFSKETFVEWQAADTISRLTADNEALRKERDGWKSQCLKAEFDHGELGRLTDKYKARADALAQEVERLKTLLREVLDGRECGWILTDTDLVPEDVTSAFFEKVARAALANEEAGR